MGSIVFDDVMLGGVLVLMARFVAAFGHGLVDPAEERPSQPELLLLFGAHHRRDYTPYLRHGGRDQLGMETRAEIPFLAEASSSSATERNTAR